MIKKLITIGMCLLLVFLSVGCSTEKPNENDIINSNTEKSPEDRENPPLTDEGIIKPEYAKEVIKERSHKVIKAIKDKDVKNLATFVHPEKGVRFTPYTYVSLDNDIIFTKEDILNFFKDEKKYLWGRYDGIGNDISLTPSEYYEEFIYTADFINADEIGYNEVLSSGNMLENQFEVYDKPIIVEYYFPYFNKEFIGMDWKSLRLVFEELNGEWYLVGIIHNQWTI